MSEPARDPDSRRNEGPYGDPPYDDLTEFRSGLVPSPSPARRRRPRRVGGERIVCLLTTLHPERGLSRALVQHLAQEMSDIDFTMQPRPGVHVVWVCGYERGRPDLVHRLRMSYPQALIVVTGRGPLTRWGPEVVEAGADHACGWPLPYGRLERLFHSPRQRQPLA